MNVRCNHCSAVYSLGGVKQIARYADCDVFETPCCHRIADTRSWKSLPDYQRIQSGELRRDSKGKLRDVDGRYLRVVRA